MSTSADVHRVSAVVVNVSTLRAVSAASVHQDTNWHPIVAPAKISTNVRVRAASAPTASVRI